LLVFGCCRRLTASQTIKLARVLIRAIPGQSRGSRVNNGTESDLNCSTQVIKMRMGYVLLHSASEVGGVTKKIRQVFVALGPLLLTPLLGFLLAEGFVNLGGGEKDIIWAFIWAVWSIIFAISSLILIWRNWALDKWVVRSTIVGTAGLVAVWVLAISLLAYR